MRKWQRAILGDGVLHLVTLPKGKVGKSCIVAALQLRSRKDDAK